MPSFSRHNLILVRYPFSDLSSSKVRPAVVVNAPHVSHDLMIVPITSRLTGLLPAEFTALLKGHRDFVAVISALSEGGDLHLLAVLPDRLKATVITWLQTMPAVLRKRITTVCCDIWEGYITAVQEVLPNATIVIDRFHVARHYRDAVDELRKHEVRRLQKELPQAALDDLKHTLWPFRKRAADLDEREQARLSGLLAHSPLLQQAYRLREQLTTIFDGTA
jgi:transposase